MKKGALIKRDWVCKIVEYCNKDLVPAGDFDPADEYHSDWFEKQFSFVDNESLRKQLGMAFYQARFLYKLMSALRLPRAKHYGIVKFQIIQYASICEAIIERIVCAKFKSHLKKSRPSMPDFVDVAVDQGVIGASVGDRIKGLYRTRNNVHLLKAASVSYKPRLIEAKEGYALVKDMISDVRSFYEKTNH